MASEREPTPEKQLLDLIEKPKPNDIQQAAIKRRGFSLFSFGALKSRLSFFKKETKNVFQAKKEPGDIGRINRLLRFCVLILTAYLVSSFIISFLNLDKLSSLDLKTNVSAMGKIAEVPTPLKKSAYYLEQVRSRDIFNPLWSLTDEGEDETGAWSSISKIAEEAKNLKLVGISWSDDPDTMIEDTKFNKVHFLKKGEMIGEIKIEAIFRDKVLLSFEGEELELR